MRQRSIARAAPRCTRRLATTLYPSGALRQQPHKMLRPLPVLMLLAAGNTPSLADEARPCTSSWHQQQLASVAYRCCANTGVISCTAVAADAAAAALPPYGLADTFDACPVVAAEPLLRVPHPKPPYRAYSFTPNTTSARMYTGTNLFTDMGQHTQADEVTAVLALGIVPLRNAMGPGPVGKVCSKRKMNHSACVEHFADSVRLLTAQQAAAADGIVWSGRSINEWTLHNLTRPTNAANSTLDYARAAAEGYRLAKRRDPALFLAAWITNPDDTFASLMADGTFDLALVEGYSFCPVFNCSRPITPGCNTVPGEWASCAHNVNSYLPRLAWARREGFINRTIFSTGWLIAQSRSVPHGWTKSKLRAEAMKLKRMYPEMPG